MKVNETATLEVAAGIPRVCLEKLVAEKQPGGCEQLRDTRGARPMHAGHDQDRRSWGRCGGWRERHGGDRRAADKGVQTHSAIDHPEERMATSETVVGNCP
jgi:hypothetical protein